MLLKRVTCSHKGVPPVAGQFNAAPLSDLRLQPSCNTRPLQSGWLVSMRPYCQRFPFLAHVYVGGLKDVFQAVSKYNFSVTS